jgi:hypothetical protein
VRLLKHLCERHFFLAVKNNFIFIHTQGINNIINPRKLVLIETLTIAQLNNKALVYATNSSIQCFQESSMVLTLTKKNPVHILNYISQRFILIYFNIIFPSTPRSPKLLFFSGFRLILSVLTYAMRAHAPSISSSLTWWVSSEEYKLRRSPFLLGTSSLRVSYN